MRHISQAKKSMEQYSLFFKIYNNLNPFKTQEDIVALISKLDDILHIFDSEFKHVEEITKKCQTSKFSPYSSTLEEVSNLKFLVNEMVGIIKTFKVTNKRNYDLMIEFNSQINYLLSNLKSAILFLKIIQNPKMELDLTRNQ